MRLKQYLTEKYLKGGRAPLYHFTYDVYIEQIIKMDALGKIDPKDPMATTINPESGKKLVKHPIYFTRSKKYRVSGRESNVVLVFNQEKLRQKYKIKPRVDPMAGYKDYPGSHREEAEEYIIGPVWNMSKYLIAFHMDKKSHTRMVKHLSNVKIWLERERTKDHTDEKPIRLKMSGKRIVAYTKSVEDMERVLKHSKLKVGLP